MVSRHVLSKWGTALQGEPQQDSLPNMPMYKWVTKLSIDLPRYRTQQHPNYSLGDPLAEYTIYMQDIKDRRTPSSIPPTCFLPKTPRVNHSKFPEALPWVPGINEPPQVYHPRAFQPKNSQGKPQQVSALQGTTIAEHIGSTTMGTRYK